MLSKSPLSAASPLVLATLSILAAVPTQPAKADGESDFDGESLIGSWRVRISFDDGRPDDLTLYKFERDRTFPTNGNRPGPFGPGNVSLDRNRGGDTSINLTFVRMFYSPSEAKAASGALNPALHRTLNVQAKLTVSDDGQSFSGRYLLSDLDSNGNVRSTTAGELIASRLTVGPVS